jgi:IS4 transposase
MLGQSDANRFFPVVETQKGPSMRYLDSIFGRLLKPIDRRQFQRIVDRVDGDAYDKSFKSWDHLVTMTYAQFSRAGSLRELEASFNANAQHHYHLGVDKLARATLSDANARRPVAVFAQTFSLLTTMADRLVRREGAAMVRLIDASPVPLGQLCKWATWNGRFRGMKLHVVYDPGRDIPRCVEVTPANVNDVEIGRQVTIEPGAMYVFDKGYCRFDWWANIHNCKAFFVTRPKTNMRLKAVNNRPLRRRNGDGFKVIKDQQVVLVSKGDSRLPIPLRRIKVKREEGGSITLLTNDLQRTAIEIAALYKGRWQIELLFRWLKQHLAIRKFLGTHDNAIRLQILAAMIAFLLLRIATHLNRVTMLPIRFAQLVGQFLFTRRSIADIEKPPEVNLCKPKPRSSPNQLEFCYA